MYVHLFINTYEHVEYYRVWGIVRGFTLEEQSTFGTGPTRSCAACAGRYTSCVGEWCPSSPFHYAGLAAFADSWAFMKPARSGRATLLTVGSWMTTFYRPWKKEADGSRDQRPFLFTDSLMSNNMIFLPFVCILFQDNAMWRQIKSFFCNFVTARALHGTS